MFRQLVISSLVLFVFQKCQGFTVKKIKNPGSSDLFELSILHLNDFHSRFLQTGPSSSSTCNQTQKNDCIGGIARISTISKKILNEKPNFIFLNAGDNFQGTVWYNIFKWNVTANILNKLPFDAMTIGNHEFDDGIGGLVPFLKNVKSPVVVSNINDTNVPSIKGLYKNSTIIMRGGRKIGVIGVILSTTNLIATTEKLSFFDEVTSVNNEAEKLKGQGVEIIIALSHCGLDVDRILAVKCPNVDIIVGGHSHTFLYFGKKPFTDNPVDEYPVVVKQTEENRTVLIVQAASFSRYIGNLTVWFNPQGEIVDWDGNPILLNHDIKEDPEMLRVLEPWKEAVDKIGKEPVGTTNVYLHGLDDLNSCRIGECNLANLVTDSMVDYYVGKAENNTYWTKAAIACINAAYIRGDISNKPGIITYEDILVIAPFGNIFHQIELKGSDILKALEKAVVSSYSKTEFVGKSFIQWSGVKVVYNLSNADYSRVVDAKVRCQACQKPKYENLVPNEWYRVVVPTFLLNGGDDHTEISQNYRNHQSGPLDINVIVDYIKKNSPINTSNESRIRFLGTWNKL